MTDDEPITLAAVVDRCVTAQQQKSNRGAPRKVTVTKRPRRRAKALSVVGES